ncbi:uncharacterized protein PV06_11159 [Exophiala oligosperma]|uniref:Uncharacterized protein n=1 Tax=Exophiala oligosperma TaxID=215243 RepID=A0A0D2BGP0_9EURO|nr:uncharacterized protein PV06_11159 [Exophiala oligosperma]KIW36647.1 hypothetical protein PV06_11159 [Exophiala oligosperma]
MDSIQLAKGKHALQKKGSADCIPVNCETLFDRAVSILCLKEAASSRYRAVAASLSESEPLPGRRFSILLTGAACSSASLSIESLLGQSARLLQHCLTTADGVEYLQTGNLDVLNENDSGNKIIEPTPSKIIWIALILRYENQDYHFLKRWDIDRQSFGSLVYGIVRPMIASQQEMNTYVGDIWVTLDKTEYLIQDDKADALYDFVCSERDAPGRLGVRVYVYRATNSDGIRIDELSRLAPNDAAYRALR